MLRLSNCSTRGNHVINNEYPAGQRCTDNAASLAMAFGFLSIESIRYVKVMMFSECGSRQSGKRDTFVSRAEKHVEFNV